MRLFVEPRNGLPVLEQDHGRALFVAVPQFGQFRVVLSLDAEKTPIREMHHNKQNAMCEYQTCDRQKVPANLKHRVSANTIALAAQFKTAHSHQHSFTHSPNKRGPILQQFLGAKNIILDIGFGVGIVKIDEHRFILGKECQDFVHCLVLGGKRRSAAAAGGSCSNGCSRHRWEDEGVSYSHQRDEESQTGEYRCEGFHDGARLVSGRQRNKVNLAA